MELEQLTQLLLTPSRSLQTLIFEGRQVPSTKLQCQFGKYFLHLQPHEIRWSPGLQTEFKEHEIEDLRGNVEESIKIFNRIYDTFIQNKFEYLTLTELNHFYAVITYRQDEEVINYTFKVKARKLIVTNPLESLIIKPFLQDVLGRDDTEGIREALSVLNNHSRIIQALSLMNSGIIPFSAKQKSRFRLGGLISCICENMYSYLISLCPDYPKQIKRSKAYKVHVKYEITRVSLSKTLPNHFSLQVFSSIEQSLVGLFGQLLGPFPYLNQVVFNKDSILVQTPEYDGFAYIISSWISLAYSFGAIRSFNVILHICPNVEKNKRIDPTVKLKITDANKVTSSDPAFPLMLITNHFQSKVVKQEDSIFTLDFQYLESTFKKYQELIEYSLEVDKEHYYSLVLMNLFVVELEEYIEYFEILQPMLRAYHSLVEAKTPLRAQVRVNYRETYEHMMEGTDQFKRPEVYFSLSDSLLFIKFSVALKNPSTNPISFTTRFVENENRPNDYFMMHTGLETFFKDLMTLPVNLSFEKHLRNR